MSDRQLTSKEAQQKIIGQRKTKIENRYASPYATKFHKKEKQPQIQVVEVNAKPLQMQSLDTAAIQKQ